jgi:hypothetical protein
MRHRVLFGKALPRSLVERPLPAAALFLSAAAVAAVAWFTAMLASRRSRALEDTVYVWPD